MWRHVVARVASIRLLINFIFFWRSVISLIPSRPPFGTNTSWFGPCKWTTLPTKTEEGGICQISGFRSISVHHYFISRWIFHGRPEAAGALSINAAWGERRLLWGALLFKCTVKPLSKTTDANMRWIGIMWHGWFSFILLLGKIFFNNIKYQNIFVKIKIIVLIDGFQFTGIAGMIKLIKFFFFLIKKDLNQKWNNIRIIYF